MRRKKYLSFSMLGVAAVLAGPLLVLSDMSVASAQAPAPAAAQPASPSVRLAPEQQIAEASNYVAKMEGIRSSIQRELKDAREQNDVVKTLCLDDKLNQIDVVIRKSESRSGALKQAVERKDADLANHEFTILAVLYDRAGQLDVEAKQCIGKEAGFVGESSSSMTIDEPLAPEEADFPGFPVIIEPPTCSSCIR